MEHSYMIENIQDPKRRLSALIGVIDALISDQLAQILNHPEFLSLYEKWLGLQYLCSLPAKKSRVKIKLLNAKWNEITKDLSSSSDFESSFLFRHIYTSEFDTPGGEPFTMILGQYYLFPHENSWESDIYTLSELSHIMMTAFCTFYTSPHPYFFGLQTYERLQEPLLWEHILRDSKYISWLNLQKRWESRFINFSLPRFRLKKPLQYGTPLFHDLAFTYPYMMDEPWGHPSFVVAAWAIASYEETHWFESMTGYSYHSTLKENIYIKTPYTISHLYNTSSSFPKSLQEIYISELRERELREIGITSCLSSLLFPVGFMAVCASITEYHQEKGNPEFLDPTDINMNYLMCACRFAHYIKVIFRDKIGSFTNADELERYIHKWLNSYSINQDTGSEEMRLKYPLKSSSIQIKEDPSKPGQYKCEMVLQPHFRTTQTNVSLRFVTKV